MMSYGITGLERVKCVVRESVSLGYFSSLLVSAMARFNEFVCVFFLKKDAIACVPFPGKKDVARTRLFHVLVSPCCAPVGGQAPPFLYAGLYLNSFLLSII